MIKNVLPSLRQRAGPQRICSRQKSIRSGTARDSFSQTPHMLGKEQQLTNAADQVRITPAHAGKRLADVAGKLAAEDHSRMCGEKCTRSPDSTSSSGSPPHVRGKDTSSRTSIRHSRITPACAGKSRWVFHHCILTLGSPPRMRGKVSGAVRRGAAVGITPRTCGEKRCGKPLVDFFRGSPPRMRGKGDLKAADYQQVRITPAYAGKRARYTPRCSRSRDHPRMCGEKAPV